MKTKLIFAAILLLGALGLLSAQQANYPAGAPGGANTQVQFNSNGAFGGNAGFTFNGTSSVTINTAGTSTGFLTVGTSGFSGSSISISGNNGLAVLKAQDGGTPANNVASTVGFVGTNYQTTTNCSVNSASPAACGAAVAGAFVVPTTTTSYTVNTTLVHAASRIHLTPLTFAADLPSTPTCVAPAAGAVTISAITAGTSFSFALPSTAGQTCWYYFIVN